MSISKNNIRITITIPRKIFYKLVDDCLYNEATISKYITAILSKFYKISESKK